MVGVVFVEHVAASELSISCMSSGFLGLDFHQTYGSRPAQSPRDFRILAYLFELQIHIPFLYQLDFQNLQSQLNPNPSHCMPLGTFQRVLRLHVHRRRCELCQGPMQCHLGVQSGSCKHDSSSQSATCYGTQRF